MKKLIHSFERDGRLFEVVDDNGQLYYCLVEHAGDSLKPAEHVCYAEYEGCDIYQSHDLWHREIDKSEVHLEDALYQRFLVETDFLRYIGAF